MSDLTSLKIGSLFTGYGGLDLAVESVTGAATAWVSDIDKGASKIIDHRFGHVPNLGDITNINWSDVEPVDILTGGFPCQDLSHAGKRAGMKPGTRSGLWSHMAYAINELRPSLVVAENVRGLLSGRTDRSEQAVTVGPKGGRKVGYTERALGRVLADLADLGYDASWYGLHAGRTVPLDGLTHVGAPHGRFRVFVVAYPRGEHGLEWGLTAPGQAQGRRAFGELAGCDRAPLTLLPTPAVNDMGKAYTPDEWDAWTEKMKAAHGNGNGHGKSLEIEAARLLPTPRAENGNPRNQTAWERPLDQPQNIENAVYHTRFGQYAGAVSRWEALTRPAPEPTQPTGRGGAHRLSPHFTEWMMGLPEGWITDVPGITRNEALKACGNGVVPQQAAKALEVLLPTVSTSHNMEVAV